LASKILPKVLFLLGLIPIGAFLCHGYWMLFVPSLPNRLFWGTEDSIAHAVEELESSSEVARNSLPLSVRSGIDSNLPSLEDIRCPGDELIISVPTGVLGLFGTTSLPGIGSQLPTVNEGIKATCNTTIDNLSRGLTCTVKGNGCVGLPITGRISQSQLYPRKQSQIIIEVECRIEADPRLCGTVLRGTLNGSGDVAVPSGERNYLVAPFSFSEEFAVSVTYPAIRTLAQNRIELDRLHERQQTLRQATLQPAYRRMDSEDWATFIILWGVGLSYGVALIRAAWLKSKRSST
jgi:hypothetical protein